jgi:hypothetical protein
VPRVEDSWDDESVVHRRVDVEVQPADEPPFAASCDLSLLGAYSVSPGEPVTVAHHAENKRWAHILRWRTSVEAMNQWPPLTAFAPPACPSDLAAPRDDPPRKRSRAPDLRPQRRGIPLGGAVGLDRAGRPGRPRATLAQ